MTVAAFLGQVKGRKLFRLIAPFHLASVYNDPNDWDSNVSLDGPVDFDRFPLMRDVPIAEGTL
jgi:hypothetical protein